MALTAEDLMPQVVRGQTNASIVMMTEQIADQLRGPTLRLTVGLAEPLLA